METLYLPLVTLTLLGGFPGGSTPGEKLAALLILLFGLALSRKGERERKEN